MWDICLKIDFLIVYNYSLLKKLNYICISGHIFFSLTKSGSFNLIFMGNSCSEVFEKLPHRSSQQVSVNQQQLTRSIELGAVSQAG